jgi:hypothetical protein
MYKVILSFKYAYNAGHTCIFCYKFMNSNNLQDILKQTFFPKFYTKKRGRSARFKVAFLPLR